MKNAKEIFKKAFYFLLKEESQAKRTCLQDFWVPDVDNLKVGDPIFLDPEATQPAMGEGEVEYEAMIVKYKDGFVVSIEEKELPELEIPIEPELDLAEAPVPAIPAPEEVAPAPVEDVDALKKEIEDLKKQIEDMKAEKEAKAKEEVKMSAEPATQAPRSISDKVTKKENGFTARGKFAALFEIAKNSN